MSAFNKTVPALPFALSVCVIGTLSPVSGPHAAENPFVSTELPAGYMLLAEDSAKQKEGKCGEGKCGGKKVDSEAVCGIYDIGSAHKDESKVKDGKCGGHKVVEALCGG